MINDDQYDAYLNRNISYKLKAVMFTIVPLLLVFSTSNLPNKPHFFQPLTRTSWLDVCLVAPPYRRLQNFSSLRGALSSIYSDSTRATVSMDIPYLVLIKLLKILGRVYCKQLQQQT